jgi:hypothetical protein
LIHEDYTFAPHEPDHIFAEKHGGPTIAENLALACAYCNRHKGSDMSSLDPLTQKPVCLFHPRNQQWRRHFRLNGPRIEPLTAAGRATVMLLQFNVPDRIQNRLDLMAMGVYP